MNATTNHLGDTQARISNEISVIDVIHFLWKNKILITIVTVFSTTLAILYAIFAQQIFSTQTIFVTKTNSNSNSSLSSLASLAGISLGSSANIDPSDYLDKVIEDKNFISKLLSKKWNYKGDSLYLDQIWGFKPDTTISNWKQVNELNKIDFIRNQHLMIINKDKKTGILTLTTNAPEAQLAFDIGVFVIEQIGDYIRNSVKSQAKEKRLFIEERIAEVKFDLEKSENALAIFRERNISSSSPKVALEEMRLTRNATLNQEIYIQFQKQYELTRVEEKNDQTLIQIIRNPEVPIYRSKPNRKQLVILGCGLGFFIGIGLSYLLVLFNNWKKKI